MSGEQTKTKRKAWAGEFFSAKYFLLRAVAIVVLFSIAQLAGLREYTTFLSGTVVNPEAGHRLSAFYGMVYIALYLGSLVAAPILVIAAGLLACWQRRIKIRRTD